MRWIVSIIVGLCLVGAGTMRRDRTAHEGDPYSRSELSAANHVAKVTSRRASSPAPDLRLAAFTIVTGGFELAPPPRVMSSIIAHLELAPSSSRLSGHSARGPPG